METNKRSSCALLIDSAQDVDTSNRDPTMIEGFILGQNTNKKKRGGKFLVTLWPWNGI